MRTSKLIKYYNSLQLNQFKVSKMKFKWFSFSMHKISFQIGLNILNPNYFRTYNFDEVIWHVIRTLLINKNENRYSNTSTKKISHAIRIFEYYSNTYMNIRIPILGFVAILTKNVINTIWRLTLRRMFVQSLKLKFLCNIVDFVVGNKYT